MSCHSTFTTWFGKVGHIYVYQQYHGACFVSNACIWVCSNVAKELVTCINHCPCAITLSCCNGAECGKKCWVNCSRIVQEGTDNVLDVFDLFWGEWLHGVDLHPLNPCTILDWCRHVGRMLGKDWFGMLVLCESFVDIAGHMAIGMSLHVVSGELYAAKKRSLHVDCNGVVLLQCINKVVHVMHIGNFDAKVIYH
jgi:hypothetical protein